MTARFVPREADDGAGGYPALLDTPRVPWSPEAEQSVLGGLLLDNAAHDRIAGVLEANSFFSQQHTLVWGVITGLIAAGKPADVITVFEELRERGLGERSGGLAYLNALAQSVPSAANIRRYAEIVRERHGERMLRFACDEALTMALGTGSMATKLDAIQGKFSALSRHQVRSMPVSMRGVAAACLEAVQNVAEGNGPECWSTHLGVLDRLLLGGFRPGRVYFVGARPSVGKSALAQWWTLQLARATEAVTSLILSQEMPKREVGDRALAMVAQVPYEGIQTGTLSQAQWSALSEATDILAGLPTYVDDQADLTIGDIRMKARYVPGMRLLVVDYVQLCKGADEGNPNRNQELEIISRGLKSLAKELDCAVVVLSQLKRYVDERPHKRPIMSDLKDCGGLEQDADAVILLFPVMWRRHEGIWLIGMDLPKNRQGPKGSGLLAFKPTTLDWWEETRYDLDELLKPGARQSKTSLASLPAQQQKEL